MKTALTALAVLMLSIQPIPAASVPDIGNEAELDEALKQAKPNDVLALKADIEITKTKKIPTKVTLLGNGHAITAASGLLSSLIRQDGQTGVIVRGARLVAPYKSPWSIEARNGDIRLIDCFLDARAIAWENGSVTIEDSTSHMLFPPGNDGVGPYGAFGNRASFTAKNSLFIIGWETNQLDNGFFINFGGDIASELTIANCTIVCTTDNHPELGGDFRAINRHLSLINSNNTAGGDYLTTVYNSVFIGEASAVFRSNGSGAVISHHNNNAGMLRNPAAFKFLTADPPGFYSYTPDNTEVRNRLADFREYNPFADATAGDYRLMAHTRSASAADDGGPVGARIGIVEKEHNAFNLSFSQYDSVIGRSPLGATEEAFYGWRWNRGDPQQLFLSVAEGQDKAGRALRLETRDTVNQTGAAFHDGWVAHGVYQTFCVIPGHVYTIKAWSRRGSCGKGVWPRNGMYGSAILGVANGAQTDPSKMDETVIIKGAEGQWTEGAIQSFRADTTQITVHLIHRTNGSWNYSEWDNVTVEGGPNPDISATKSEE